MSHDRTYHIEVHHEDDGSLWAQVVELPGCFASGFNFEELRLSLQEAIGLYLSDGDHEVEITAGELSPSPSVERRELKLCAV